jgi:hypothetical protein
VMALNLDKISDEQPSRTRGAGAIIMDGQGLLPGNFDELSISSLAPRASRAPKALLYHEKHAL